MMSLQTCLMAVANLIWRFRNLLAIIFPAYILLVRHLRYQRSRQIKSMFSNSRPFSTMTTAEAHEIMAQLQELEFPYAFNKARRIALLKAGGIPTMSKLFAVTGQNTRRNAGKRAVDTEILLREAQTKERSSIRYMQAVARMNFFHARYRKAGKILNEDLLHTLGDGLVETLRIVNCHEWRNFTDVETCAIGLFHYNLGEDMDIPYASLPSHESGWSDGLHFANELSAWTIGYEKQVCIPGVATNDQYVRVYVDSATSALGKGVTDFVRKSLGSELDDTMRISLNLPAPGLVLRIFLETMTALRKTALRHLALPRPSFLRIKGVDDDPNPISGLYNFNHAGFRPWYIKPTVWLRWGPMTFLMRCVGAKAPGDEKYMPGGYDLTTLGPEPQKGKGIEDMKTTVEFLKSRGVAGCPFSKGELN